MARFSQLASVISRVQGLPNSSFFMGVHDASGDYTMSAGSSLAVNRKGIIALHLRLYPNNEFLLVLLDKTGDILEKRTYSHLGSGKTAEIYHDPVTDGFYIYSKNSNPGSAGDTYLMLVADDGSIVDQIELGGNIEYGSGFQAANGGHTLGGCVSDDSFFLPAHDQTNNEMFVAKFNTSTGSIVSSVIIPNTSLTNVGTSFSGYSRRPLTIGGNETDGFIIASFNNGNGADRLELTTVYGSSPYSVWGGSTSASSFCNHCLFVGQTGDRVIFDIQASNNTQYFGVINDRDLSTNDLRRMTYSVNTPYSGSAAGDAVYPSTFAQRKDNKATVDELRWCYALNNDIINSKYMQVIMPFKSDLSVSSMDRDFTYIEVPEAMLMVMHFDYQGNVYLLGDSTSGVHLIKLDYDAVWDNVAANITYDYDGATYTIHTARNLTQLNTQTTYFYTFSSNSVGAANPLTSGITSTASANTSLSLANQISGFGYNYHFETDTLPYVPLPWSVELTISNPDIEPSDPTDYFGRNLDMSENYVVVSATGEDLGGAGAGVAYVFNLSGDLLYTLQNPVPSSTGFGTGVAVDGNYIAIGDYDYNTNGRVYVYDITTFGSVGSTITSANYTLESFATAPDGATQSGSSWFGWQVAIHNGWLVVGAPATTHTNQGSHGAAYLYDISTFSTGSITSATYILANPNLPSGTADRMGYSVAIDGKWIAVGIPGAEDNPKTYEGAVYVWDKSTFGAVGSSPAYTWEFQNPTQTSFFTRGNQQQIAISETAGHVLIGSYNETSGGLTQAGRAYLGSLTTGSYFYNIDTPNPINQGFFGQGVALSADGRYAFIAQQDNLTSQAALYVYDTAKFVGGITASPDYTTKMSNNFPAPVAANSNRAVIANGSTSGAPQLVTQHKR